MEICLLGGIPVVQKHVAFAVLFGTIYIGFMWLSAPYWKPSKGPQYFYFFFDTTLGFATTISMLALLLVLMVCYTLFCQLNTILHNPNLIGSSSTATDDGDDGSVVGLLAQVGAVVAISYSLCKFKD